MARICMAGSWPRSQAGNAMEAVWDLRRRGGVLMMSRLQVPRLTSSSFAAGTSKCQFGLNSACGFSSRKKRWMKASKSLARRVRLKGAPALLTGRIFDDRGNRMSPTHANKRGVRYRYYVSHALLQKQKSEAGTVARVPAPEIEALVLDGVRKQIASSI